MSQCHLLSNSSFRPGIASHFTMRRGRSLRPRTTTAMPVAEAVGSRAGQQEYPPEVMTTTQRGGKEARTRRGGQALLDRHSLPALYLHRKREPSLLSRDSCVCPQRRRHPENLSSPPGVLLWSPALDRCLHHPGFSGSWSGYFLFSASLV